MSYGNLDYYTVQLLNFRYTIKWVKFSRTKVISEQKKNTEVLINLRTQNIETQNINIHCLTVLEKSLDETYEVFRVCFFCFLTNRMKNFEWIIWKNMYF